MYIFTESPSNGAILLSLGLSHLIFFTLILPQVESDVTELQFFSTPLLLGPNGIEANLGMGTLIDFEQEALEKMKPELSGSIAKGIKFANQ